ncbi:hypothetical protein BLOT_013275 [Blomia tropicalis]|nr:hypothetical protein BLOT_013275 [Blomia tropicalis]
MKLLFLQLTFILIGSVVAFELNETLGDILKELRLDLDTTLVTLFPELAPEINKLRNVNDECYNKMVGNQTINIFNESIPTIITQFYKRYPTEQSRLVFFSHIPNILENLFKLAKKILDCVNESNPAKRTANGITSLFIYSESQYLKQILDQSLGDKMSSTKNISSIEQIKLGDDVQSRCSVDPLPTDTTIPDRFNWHDQGYVTPIRNQGLCESCYIFGTVAALESQYMLNVRKETVSFSEQAILNCMRPSNGYQSDGCKGGLMSDPMDRMKSIGVTLQQYAPYYGEQKNCESYPIFIKEDSYCLNEKLTNDQIKRLILRNGPGAIGINADQMMYLRGPFNDRCRNSKPNHSVLVVGWNDKYWIIKNSWTENWGLDGYLYLPIQDCNCNANLLLAQPIINSRNGQSQNVFKSLIVDNPNSNQEQNSNQNQDYSYNDNSNSQNTVNYNYNLYSNSPNNVNYNYDNNDSDDYDYMY